MFLGLVVAGFGSSPEAFIERECVSFLHAECLQGLVSLKVSTVGVVHFSSSVDFKSLFEVILELPDREAEGEEKALELAMWESDVDELEVLLVLDPAAQVRCGSGGGGVRW